MALFGRESERHQERVDAWTAWILRQNRFALVSMAFSVFSLLHFGALWVDEITGIVLGGIALFQMRRGRAEGYWLAWGGIVIGVMSASLAVVMYFVLPRARG